MSSQFTFQNNHHFIVVWCIVKGDPPNLNQEIVTHEYTKQKNYLLSDIKMVKNMEEGMSEMLSSVLPRHWTKPH